MAWFNTDWNLGNMFNSGGGGNNFSYDSSGMPLMNTDMSNPYGFTGSGAGGNMIVPWSNSVTGQTWNAPNTGYQPPSSDWQMVNSQKGTLGGQNSVWGAPAYYQKPTGMFGNNPYQAEGGGFYNPYQFGQVDYPYQYGGNNTNQQEQPWWMNYNTDNSIVNNSLPNNVPTQSDPSVIPRPGGTGPGGKDLTHAETIKYFGLYDDAEKAFAAGDKQAAYRKDHMHWRAGTGHWAGEGKKEGQSDLDYPGRKVGDNTIMGDREKLLGWSNIGNNIQDYFKQKQIFNSVPNPLGGNDITANNIAGTITTNDGTTIEVKPADDPYWNRNNNIFESKTKDKSTLNSNPAYPYVPNDDGPFNYYPTANQDYLDDSQNYSPSVTQTNNNAGMKWNQGASDGYKQLRFNQPILGKNLGTGEYAAQVNFNNHFGKTDGWNLGRPGDPNYVPFVPTYNQTNNNNLEGANKSEIDYAKEYNYQPSNWSQQINENIATPPATGNSFYEWQRNLANQAKGKLLDLGGNIFNKIIPTAEGAEINDGGNYLSRDITAGMGRSMDGFMKYGDNLQKMFDAQEAIQKKDNIFNRHYDRNQAEYTPKLSDVTDSRPMNFRNNAGQMDNRNTRFLNDNRVKTGFSGTTAADVSSSLGNNAAKKELEMEIMYRNNPNYIAHPSYGEAKGMNVINYPGFGRTELANIPVVGGVLDNIVGAGQSAAMGGLDLLYQAKQAATDPTKLFSNVIPSAFEQWKGYNQARFDPSIDTSSAKSMFDAAALLERQPSAEAIRIAKEKDAGTFIPRQTRPAKEAEAKKKVVKKATPKRVTVNYNKNKPVAVKSKPTRTPAPKVTRTTGSRGGRGNVAKKRKTYTSKGGW